MNGVREIKNLEGLLSSSLGDGEKIKSCDVSVLTEPGENFGSIVLKLTIKIENKKNGKYRILDAVGKIIPESKRVQELFNTQVTFRNEYMFYSSIVPILDKFVKSKGISAGFDVTAPFLGGRLNLNNNEEVDTDAIIMMQNLKIIGYNTGKKLIGLDSETFKVALDSLAKFHAVGLALRLEDSTCFDKMFRPYFSDYVPDQAFLQMVKSNLVDALQNNGFTEEEIAKASAAMNRDAHKKNISELWGTMIHYDTWTNNIMIRCKEGKPVHSLILDFQDFSYGSPLNDLMFFLFTSVQPLVLENNLEDLLQYYFKLFVQNLKDLDIDTKKYTKESFENEVKTAVKDYEYCHSIWMLIPIMHEGLNSMDELDNEGEKEKKMKWDEKHVQKIVQITRLSLKNNWI